jgi:hypothetical protein
MDNFLNLAKELPEQYRSVQINKGVRPKKSCFFGIKRHENFGWKAFEKIPRKAVNFEFCLGSSGLDLLTEFSKSDLAKKVEFLVVGNSLGEIGKGKDFSEIVKVMSESEFPKLKALYLGDWDIYSHLDCVYGSLGDITNLFKNMPLLQKLKLGGYFELTEKLNLPLLEDIQVKVDYAGGNETLSISTYNNLLLSYFPKLEELYYELGAEFTTDIYTFCDEFLTGNKTPNLSKLEICGTFKTGEKKRIQGSKLGLRNGLRLCLDDLTESNNQLTNGSIG